jgi:hypothetical protein
MESRARYKHRLREPTTGGDMFRSSKRIKMERPNGGGGDGGDLLDVTSYQLTASSQEFVNKDSNQNFRYALTKNI